MRHIVVAALLVASVLGLPVPGYSQESGSTTAALTNENVIALHRGGLGASVIVNAITGAPSTAFDVSPAALLELKNAGVPEAVILVMQNRASSQGTAGRPSPSSLAEARVAFLVNAAVGPNWIGINDRFKELRLELTTWRRFELVEVPEAADVVITLGTASSGQTSAVAVGNIIVAASSPVYTLTIQQRATGRVFWTSSEQVGSFSAKGTLKKLLKRLREQVPTAVQR